MEEIRVVLAEDHHVVRAAVAEFLDKEADIQVVGQVAQGGAPLLDLVGEAMPDVLVLDAHMPNHRIVESAQNLTLHYPEVKILVLSAYDRREYIDGVLKVGAAGYVLKDDSPETLVHAIRSVARGERWLSPKAANVLLGAGYHNVPEISPGLTPREIDVLTLMAKGYRNEQIAEELVLSPQTVKNHVRHIYVKLEVETRVAAVLYALNHDLVSPK